MRIQMMSAKMISNFAPNRIHQHSTEAVDVANHLSQIFGQTQHVMEMQLTAQASRAKRSLQPAKHHMKSAMTRATLIFRLTICSSRPTDPFINLARLAFGGIGLDATGGLVLAKLLVLMLAIHTLKKTRIVQKGSKVANGGNKALEKSLKTSLAQT